MTGILSKAMRGAATAGAELSMENHRAAIQAQRDKRLQEYQTSERVAGEAHDMKMLAAGKGAGAQQGDIQLMNYLQEHGIASSPEDAFSKIREMDTDPSKVIVDIAKSMQAADASAAEPKPFSAYLEQAEKDVNALRERMNPKKPSPGAPTKENVKPKGILNQNMGGGMIEQAIDSAIQSGAADPKPDAEPPPVAGARKSPKDGKWYVQKDGRWFMVDK